MGHVLVIKLQERTCMSPSARLCSRSGWLKTTKNKKAQRFIQLLEPKGEKSTNTLLCLLELTFC